MNLTYIIDVNRIIMKRMKQHSSLRIVFHHKDFKYNVLDDVPYVMKHGGLRKRLNDNKIDEGIIINFIS